MIQPTPGPVKKPRGKGFMSASMVLPLHEVLTERVGPEQCDALFGNAGMRFLPGPEEHVRERQVLDIHRAVRSEYGDLGMEMLREAGQRAADIVTEYRIPPSGKVMLRRMPWPLAAWMCMRSASQRTWTFGGSAQFHSRTTSRFELIGNPAIRGERASKPICVFHQAMFQRLFQTLAHPRMECVELGCEACGDDACLFEIRVTPET